MSSFELAIGKILSNEGDAVVSDDHGRGASKYGITLATYRYHHPLANPECIINMTREQAMEFYQHDYGWDRLNIGLIESQAVAEKVFDLAVNIGPRTAIKILQRAACVKDDGVLGPKTAAAVNSIHPDDLLRAIYQAGVSHYDAVLETHPGWENCREGWMARLAQGVPA